MRGFLTIMFVLVLSNVCFGQEIFVPLKSIEVIYGEGNELTNTYRWSQNGKGYIIYAEGILESESGRKLKLPISKGHHVNDLSSGSFRNDLVISFSNYSGGYGNDFLCMIDIGKHRIKWCRRVTSQISGGYRAAPASGKPLDFR